jgi:hypothetical protein
VLGSTSSFLFSVVWRELAEDTLTLHSFIIQIAADAAGAIYLQWVLVTGHAEL